MQPFVTWNLSHAPRPLISSNSTQLPLSQLAPESIARTSNGIDPPQGFLDRRELETLPSEPEGKMRRSKFTDEQMVAILREADRDPIASVASAIAARSRDCPTGACDSWAVSRA